MNSTFFNYNESKKKRIVFFNILASSIIFFFLLFGQINSSKVGLGKHTSDGANKVILANGSRVANQTDIEQYKKDFVDACDVELDDRDRIILHYKKEGAAKRGCTVDILTKNNEFQFWVMKVKNENNCITKDINDNVIPFAYSLSNDEFTRRFSNSPFYIDKKCDDDEDDEDHKRCCACNFDCIDTTFLEISWRLTDKVVVMSVNPIDTNLMISSTLKETDEPTLSVQSGDPRYYVYNNGLLKETRTPPCQNISKIVNKLEAWEIINKIPNEEMDRLLVFHFLPQKATFKKFAENDGYAVRRNVSLEGGPKCDDLKIKFDSQYYKLLISDPPEIINTSEPLPTKSSINSTDNEVNLINSTSTIDWSKETDKTTNSKKPKSTKFTESTIKEATITTVKTTEGSFNILIIVGIVGGLFVLCCFVVIVSCFCLKGSKKKKECAEEEEAKQEGVEDEKKKEDGEEDKSKDEGDKSKKDEKSKKDKDKSKKDKVEKSKEDDDKSKEDEKSKEEKEENER